MNEPTGAAHTERRRIEDILTRLYHLQDKAQNNNETIRDILDRLFGYRGDESLGNTCDNRNSVGQLSEIERFLENIEENFNTQGDLLRLLNTI